MTVRSRPVGSTHKAHRLEALSDGVFAVALTVLIFDVVAAANAAAGTRDLARHLLGMWPTLAAYLIGFLTILVCWINHQRVFHYLTGASSGLVWINGLQLALVAAVPLPTAVLATHFTGEGQRTAVVLYGITFFLMAFSFWGMWRFADRRGLTDPGIDPDHYPGMETIYGWAVLWTVLALGVAVWSVYPALAMWALMFLVFAFPAEFARFAADRRPTT